jgi:hypothetical protein
MTAGHLFILFSSDSGVTGKVCYRSKVIGVAAEHDQRRLFVIRPQQFPATRCGAMVVSLGSLLCVRFEARPMPADLCYFAPQDEDYFWENANIAAPIIAEMQMMRARLGRTT